MQRKPSSVKRHVPSCLHSSVCPAVHMVQAHAVCFSVESVLGSMTWHGVGQRREGDSLKVDNKLSLWLGKKAGVESCSHASFIKTQSIRLYHSLPVCIHTCQSDGLPSKRKTTKYISSAFVLGHLWVSKKEEIWDHPHLNPTQLLPPPSPSLQHRPVGTLSNSPPPPSPVW